jgi:hypothetical protein
MEVGDMLALAFFGRAGEVAAEGADGPGTFEPGEPRGVAGGLTGRPQVVHLIAGPPGTK